MKILITNPSTHKKTISANEKCTKKYIHLTRSIRFGSNAILSYCFNLFYTIPHLRGWQHYNRFPTKYLVKVIFQCIALYRRNISVKLYCDKKIYCPRKYLAKSHNSCSRIKRVTCNPIVLFKFEEMIFCTTLSKQHCN